MNLGFPSWVRRAACLGMDPALFFPGRGDQDGTELAKAVCRTCEVRTPCLEWALSRTQEQDSGILGGTSERERRRARRSRRQTG